MFFKNDPNAPDGNGKGNKRVLPLLPLRDIVIFPHMVSQLFVGREKSINALDEAMNRGKEIFLVAQRNAKTNEPTAKMSSGVGSLVLAFRCAARKISLPRFIASSSAAIDRSRPTKSCETM